MDSEGATPNPEAPVNRTSYGTLDTAMAEVWVRLTVALARTQLLRRRLAAGEPGNVNDMADALSGIESELWSMEAALRISESRFRTIIDEATDYVIVTTDGDGIIDGWYPGAEAVLGWAAAEAVGKSIAMLYTPEDRASGEWQREIETARQTGFAQDARWYVRKDGSPVYISGSTRAVTGPQGEFQGLLKIGRDTTARRLGAIELRESESRFRTLVENLPDYAIFMLDSRGLINGWTEGAERVTGYTATEALGQPVTMLYTPDAVEAGVVTNTLDEATRTGRSEREGWLVRRNGDRCWVNEITTAVHGEGEALQGFTRISRDLTERRQAEEDLRLREERYRLIVEEARNYAILTTDAHARIDSWTPGAEEIFGWSAGEVLGQHFGMTFTPEDQAAGIDAREFELARRSGSAPDVRWHQRKDGRRVFIEGTTYAIRGATGEFHGVFKIGQDVTERRQAEEMLRKSEEWLQHKVAEATAELRALSRRLIDVQEEERRHLARELHDEIGQALTALGLQLGTGEFGPAQLDDARHIVHELTDQVRQLSMDLRPATLDAYGLLPAARWHIERFQTRTGIRVTLVQDGAQRRFGAAVEVAAFRVLQEALTNVARHAGTRDATVHIVADAQALTVVVRDEGKGFDPARTSTAGGLGGMRERVELLDGTLAIDAAPGRGVVVTVELPIESVDADASNEVAP